MGRGERGRRAEAHTRTKEQPGLHIIGPEAVICACERGYGRDGGGVLGGRHVEEK